MGITLEMQVEFFIWSMIAGLFAGLLYDMFRLARQMTKPKNGAIIVHDILFLVALGLVIFALSFTVGRGQLRFFEFIGIFFGFILYRMAFKNTIVKILEKFLRFLIKILITAVKIILFPFKILYKILKKPFNIIIWYIRKQKKKTDSALKIRRERFSRNMKNFKNASKKK